MELEIIRFIQSFANPTLDIIFEIVTMIGEQFIVGIVVTWFYWNYDKEKGRYLAYSIFMSLVVNNAIKDILKMPRIFGQEGIISNRVETATGYSFPSGHSQNTATFFTSLSIIIKRNWFTVIAWIIIISVGLSRLYLGVHYPKDVVCGIIFGVIISYIAAYLYNKAYSKNALLIASMVVLLPTVFFASSLDYIKSLGMFCGFVLGCVFEELFVGFTTENTLNKKIVRFVIGVIILLFAYLGGKILLPDGKIFLFIRYGCVAFIGIGIYPLVCKRLRI